jgi:hypothetical protein
MFVDLGSVALAACEWGNVQDGDEVGEVLHVSGVFVDRERLPGLIDVASHGLKRES